jgi:nicotinic acid mononucleotide adenylyltransferase/predicted nucleotidyltransferase
MKFFRKGSEQNITIPAPPTDDMGEAREVKRIIAVRSAKDVESIKNHDQEPFYAIKKFCERNQLVFHEGEFDQIIEESVPIIRHFKNKFDRKRPSQVDDTINILPSKTNDTPSYPSGHAAQSRLIAKYVAGKFPQHEAALIEAGNECGYGRVQAGFHYPSDYESGNLLGEKMYELMNKSDYMKEMKTFRSFVESIIDIPRSTYAPGVFDSADTNNPKIKSSVKVMIDKQIEDFAKEYPVIKIALIGSILTKRYRNDADLDINVLFDVPKDKQEEERLRLSKQFLSVKNPDNIQGKLIPGTKHPVNYYLITDQETYEDQNKKADAVFDITNNKFIKRPDDFTFDINLYIKDFDKKVQEIDVIKGELKRDIIDYDELSELKPGEIKGLQDKVNGKLKEIETDLQDIINIGDTVDVERRTAFDTDMTPDQIRTYGIKNRLPKNVIYKMLEKYHYLTFFKRCRKILDDGEVSDAEIDSLKGGYTEQAQSKTRAVNEALDKNKKLIFAFGRFNPPTTGHAKLMKEVIIQARKDNAKHIVYASASQDKRSNPLDVKTKVKFLKKMFPQNDIKAAGGTQRTFMEILKFYNKIYGEVVMVAGSDRISEFQKLSDKYNGKDYNYKSIKVVSSGERDPDAEGVTGMSASKMREMAKNDDYRNFKKGVVNLSDSDTKALFAAVKKGMDIKESYVGKFTDFVNNDLREEYHQERIFNIGDMVEHMDGSKGMVVRRGSNYVSYEDEGLIKKAWLYDLQSLDEEPRVPRKKGQPAGSDKHSDLYTDENPKGTIKGLGFKDVETARASVSKIKNSGKTHAHKIQAAVAMEQRAKEMGKSSEAAIYRKFINQMKEKTKDMQKESLPESPTVFSGPQNWIKRNITQRSRVQNAIKHYKDLVAKGIKGNISTKVAKLFGFDYREFADMIRANNLKVETSLIDELSKEHETLNDSYEIGTDAYTQHTMKMTPGQPIQNFRKYTDTIKPEDIIKFENEDDTIDKYKTRYKERWKEELDKAVQRMKKEL